MHHREAAGIGVTAAGLLFLLVIAVGDGIVEDARVDAHRETFRGVFAHFRGVADRKLLRVVPLIDNPLDYQEVDLSQA